MSFTKMLIVLVIVLILVSGFMVAVYPEKIEAVYQDLKSIGAHGVESRPNMEDDLSDLKDYLHNFQEDRDKMKDSK